ncbi:MAG: hypothetical protein GY866_21325 [Proteobacteria bacterium]|nr:hypothetical protein [Pseudomonadota bacterium]
MKTLFRNKKDYRNLSILIAVAIVFVFIGCAAKPIDPLSLPVQASDNDEVEFPPAPDELINRPNLLLSLVVFKDQTVTDQRLDQILSFLHQEFEQHGNFETIPRKQVDLLLSNEENRRFQPGNVADAIQLGISLKATFVGQLQVTVLESKLVDNVDQYKSNINTTIFTTSSGQVVFKQDIAFDSREQEESSERLKELVQTYFQLRGFILETRGGHRVARISLGRSSGIKQDREFEIRNRQVKSEMIDGMMRKIVSFSPLSLAKVKVIKVMENDSWVVVEKNDQAKIKKGQVVFSLPESSNPFL